MRFRPANISLINSRSSPPTGQLVWDGTHPLVLHSDEKYFIVIAAVFQGKCAILDTTSGLLERMECPAEG